MTSLTEQAERPPNLLYAVNEWPPPLRLVLLGFQYAVMAAIYLILVGFYYGLLPAFLAAGIAAALRAVGVLTTCQRINNAAWRRPDRANIRKGMLADGLSNAVGGALGVPGISIGPSLVGVSNATGVHQPGNWFCRIDCSDGILPFAEALRGLAVDRQQIKAKENWVIVRLYYAV